MQSLLSCLALRVGAGAATSSPHTVAHPAEKSTHLEEDEDEEELVDHTDAQPEPPVRYEDRAQRQGLAAGCGRLQRARPHSK